MTINQHQRQQDIQNTRPAKFSDWSTAHYETILKCSVRLSHASDVAIWVALDPLECACRDVSVPRSNANAALGPQLTAWPSHPVNRADVIFADTSANSSRPRKCKPHERFFLWEQQGTVTK